MPTPFEVSVSEALERVKRLRDARNRDPRLAARVGALKRHQRDRLARDYAQLALDPRHLAATAFFLGDLYGPNDFAERDLEFGRIVPAISRVLPEAVLRTVRDLLELHALSEELDQQMAQAQLGEQLTPETYRASWKRIDRREDRARQLAMLLEIGRALDRHTRKPLLTKMLRMMRGPARAAGLGQLQSFLERGLAAFAAMGGASDFLEAIELNERRFIVEMSE